MTPPPLILCLSGHDPTGGAGIQADIEAIKANGAQALTVITAYTVQDSHNVFEVQPVAADWLRRQLDRLLQDCAVAAIKIGLLGDAAQLSVITDTLRRLRVPVVCDPVLRAGGGYDLAVAGLPQTLIRQLLPQVTVLTPNAAEARRLVPDAVTLDDCGAALQAAGCEHVLITGGDEPGDRVRNRWYPRRGTLQLFEWPRLPETFHGAGCSLASAIAARLALGQGVGDALRGAQQDTQRWLAAAFSIGSGRRIPDRRP